MRILKKRQNELVLSCQFCEGSGVFPDTGMFDEIMNEACPVCSGTGILCACAEQGDLIDCNYCRGSGRDWNESGYFVGDTCKVCGGTGYIDLNVVGRQNDFFWDQIHPKVQELAKPRFEIGHYADAIESALKELNSIVKKKVREVTGEELDGSSLMNRAFSPNNPIIMLDDLDTNSGKDIQKGYMQIFAGTMTGIRNPKAHDNITIDHRRAVHLLYLVSLLFYKLDEPNLLETRG